jgi:hypothetical protein
MMIAVDKVDLYYDRLAKARQYYTDPEGAFSQHLATLSAHVGNDNFRWSVVPVCARPERFLWNGKAVEPMLEIDKRDAYLNQFLQQLMSFCV